MIRQFIAEIEPILPLNVRSVEFTDPFLTLAGNGWALAIACPWELIGRENQYTSWDDSSAASVTALLAGHQIRGVDTAPNGFDPVFLLSGSNELRISADTDLDPWVFSLPGTTFVGLGHREDEDPAG